MDRWEYAWVELGSRGLRSYVWTDDAGRIEPFRAEDFRAARLRLLELFRRQGWSLIRNEDSSYVFKRARATAPAEPLDGRPRAQAVRRAAASSAG